MTTAPSSCSFEYLNQGIQKLIGQVKFIIKKIIKIFYHENSNFLLYIIWFLLNTNMLLKY